ncbi:ABC-F family ATP-binding cassette domain-containing protein [Desulforamulus aquiferis]|uniref:ABC-F family ATP-binding cassette domain-containing protein n=1 Tax=Desulforamulus aquiferis TaxID=1397668 RepID=A0AAW7ZIE9_9FIRM|nr:ABC-F family ATP-binding cassette domain-containing protein [Desulforamulus aquiferis]MDO7789095.1 ABC-F family ATP-binding cassette domain-containing protein [Desulforamulus aquiferis]RYD03058.1 hypothetical protein N752_21850 [Desulforamulus aquiferis]
MILLQANNINKYFNGNQILNNVNLTVQTNEKVGLVGVNGAGKSTLLKIITGQLSFDSGDLFLATGLNIGYLAQDTGLESKKTIYEEMLSVFADLVEQEQQLRYLEELMGNPDIKKYPDRHQRTLNQYSVLLDNFRDAGGYSFRSLIRGVLQGLEFPDIDNHSPIEKLSGGQKTRLALAKNLLIKPHLLILDEPTNYLDLKTLAWLEQFLQSYQGAVLVVSHDRYFLDAVVTKIVEIEYGQANTYKTNYSGFIDVKAQQQESQLKQYEQQLEVIARTKDFIQRNMARASTTNRAKSRLKALEKIEPVEAPAAKQKHIYFSFQVDRQSGKDVLRADNLSIGYPGLILADQINFTVERGESVALLGPNGTGKSTLLKTIIGELEPLSGVIRKGANLSIGYYAQEQEKLNPTKTVLDELWDEHKLVDERDIRTVLGNFLFRGEDVYKRVKNLSGGEKARLSLCKLMLQRANLLIMDEPTNHLDILSREILESALMDYPGTLIFVSHDRYFLNKMATRIMELTPLGIVNFPGDYDYYLEKKPQQPINPTVKEVQEKPQLNKQSFLQNKEAQRLERKRQKRIEELEYLIAESEKVIVDLEKDLEKPEIAQDYTACLKISEDLNNAKLKHEKFLEEWLELSE